MRRFEADAKYSSEQDMIVAPRTVVVRTVEEEKVLSIWDAGMGVTVTPEEVVVEEGGTILSTAVPASERIGGWTWTSMLDELASMEVVGQRRA